MGPPAAKANLFPRVRRTDQCFYLSVNFRSYFEADGPGSLKYFSYPGAHHEFIAKSIF